jgi:hypothetical protein
MKDIGKNLIFTCCKIFENVKFFAFFSSFRSPVKLTKLTAPSPILPVHRCNILLALILESFYRCIFRVSDLHDWGLEDVCQRIKVMLKCQTQLSFLSTGYRHLFILPCL